MVGSEIFQMTQLGVTWSWKSEADINSKYYMLQCPMISNVQSLDRKSRNQATIDYTQTTPFQALVNSAVSLLENLRTRR